MPAKCPLCFQKLDARQQLARVCLSHKERSENFPFDLDRKNMFCPVKTCENPRSIQTGVFLRHIGCPAKNPYWKGNGAGVVVPENAGA
jgi:hypothetical protein